jgi:hypothetical protein
MLYRNTFPEFLEAIAIGPDPSFLEKNTTFCEFASGFPQEVELMYEWKSVKRSSNPLNALRNFTKRFIIYGPDLDVQTLKFFVQKVNVFPSYYGDTVKTEVGEAFEAAKNITNIKDSPYFITNNRPINEDTNFLNKLAAMMRTCKSPCNYFKPMSSSIGTLGDFGRGLSDAASILGGAVGDALNAPTNIATNVLNKIKPQFRTEFFKLKILAQDLYQDGVKPFFSAKDRQRVKDKLNQGITPDNAFMRLPLTGDTSSYFAVSEIHSDLQSSIQRELGDCYRMFDYNQRYNPYDPEMNAAYAKRKYMGVKNGNVKSLIDILGAAAPAQYVTENTYANALDVPQGMVVPRGGTVPQGVPVQGTQKQGVDARRFDDAPKAPKYDTYDGPSKGNEAVITGGAGNTANTVQATGSGIQPPQAGAGLDNIPTNGKVLEFNFGEVKLTQYGYAMDECPDSGSEIGFGNRGNMIVPLKTIAVAPETLPATPKNPNGRGLVKPGDVLIITCTDKQGNTWTERRQVGDVSGAGLLVTKEGTFKFLIDEFTPNKKNHGSKLVDRSKSLKLKIQVADTIEPLPKWNVQEASQFAPMFICKTDWERVKKKAKAVEGQFVKAKMDTEYINYVKWSPSEPIKQSIVDSNGC